MIWLIVGCHADPSKPVDPRGPATDGDPTTLVGDDDDATTPTPPDPPVVAQACDVVRLGEATGVQSAFPGARLGAAVSGGDFDGDGTGELAVTSGAAVQVYGLVGATLVLEETVAAPVADSGFGSALVSADFDTDGRADLAIGAPDEGAVYVRFGDSLPVRFDAASLGCGPPEAGSRFGATLAAGDVDGDGAPDLVVGAPGAGGIGLVCLGLGGVGTFAPGGAWRQSDSGGSDEAGDDYGAALAVGDFDADGRADIAVGAPGEEVGAGPTDAGVVYLLRGSDGAEPLEGADRVEQEDAAGSGETGDGFGATLGAGDLDGDGDADLVVGVPNEAIGSVLSGAVFVLFGGPEGLGGGFSIDLETSGGRNEDGDRLGAAVAVADFDADGFADLVTSSPGIEEFHIYRGRPVDLGWGRLRPGIDLGVDPAGGDTVLASVGDLDGDGAIDLALGSPDTVDGGELSVVRGRPQPHGCLTHGPGVGAPGSTSARIWARADRDGVCAVHYWSDGPPVVSPPSQFSPDDDYTCTVALEGLEPDTGYTYQVWWEDVAVAEGTFWTAAEPGEAPLRFAVGADMYLGNKPFTAFDQIAADAPAFTLLIGDQIYSDIPSQCPNEVGAFRKLYKRTFLDRPFDDFIRQFPLLLIWDDHEVVNDYSPASGSADRYPAGLEAYDDYQHPFDPPSSVPGALHFAFESGDAAFFVLDARSYRSANDLSDGPDKTMLGADQKAALFAFLTASQAPFKFIVSSVPMHDFSTTGNDSWNGIDASAGAFATERAEIFAFLVDNAVPGVILVSADQHWSGVFRHPSTKPYALYEFSPTPLAIGNRELPEDSSDPNILFIDGVHRVYGLFDIDGTGSPATMTFTLRDAETGGTLYSLVLDETLVGPVSP